MSISLSPPQRRLERSARRPRNPRRATSFLNLALLLFVALVALGMAAAAPPSPASSAAAPAAAAAAYAGSYRNPGYGPLVVALRGDRLEATYNGLVTALDHWHYDTWSGGDDADPILQGMKFTFRTDRDGEVAALEAPFEKEVADILFVKEPAARLSDPAWLRRLAGAYDLKGTPVTVGLTGAGLTLSLPGQPLYHLQPALGDRFVLQGVPAISVSFALDPSGNVTGLTIHQPEGLFSATRKP